VVQLSGIFWLLCAALNIKRPRETGDGVRTVSATVARCPPTPFYEIHRKVPFVPLPLLTCSVRYSSFSQQAHISAPHTFRPDSLRARSR
jgi:hypothetical protein